ANSTSDESWLTRIMSSIAQGVRDGWHSVVGERGIGSLMGGLGAFVKFQAGVQSARIRSGFTSLREKLPRMGFLIPTVQVGIVIAVVVVSLIGVPHLGATVVPHIPVQQIL